MQTIFATLQDESTIQFRIDNVVDPHPGGGARGCCIRYNDVYHFGLAMGFPVGRMPPGYLNNTAVVERYRPHPGRSRYVGMHPEWSTASPDPLFDLVKHNLGLFTQFVAWRLSYSAFRSSQRKISDGAASTVIMSAGNDRQNIDWVIDVTKEQSAILALPGTNGAFNEIRLQLPDGMVGKVCEAYVPPKLVAQSLMSGLNAIRRSAVSVGERHRHMAAVAASTAYTDAARSISAILNVPGWELRGNRLVYTKKIVAKNVMYEGVLFDLPEELIGVLYLSEISVPVASKIDDTRGVGFHPHLDASNPDSEVNLCAGDLYDKPISEVVNLPRALETIYYDSMYGYAPSMLIEYMFQPGIGGDWPRKYPHLAECLINKYRDGESDGEVFGYEQ